MFCPHDEPGDEVQSAFAFFVMKTDGMRSAQSLKLCLPNLKSSSAKVRATASTAVL